MFNFFLLYTSISCDANSLSFILIDVDDNFLFEDVKIIKTVSNFEIENVVINIISYLSYYCQVTRLNNTSCPIVESSVTSMYKSDIET